MKIFLFVTIIFLIFPSVTIARPADPSRLPTTSPLLPMPEGSQLDYENPLNSPPEEGREDPFEILRGESSKPVEQSQAVEATAAGESSGHGWVIWIVFLVATVVLFVYAFRAKKPFG